MLHFHWKSFGVVLLVLHSLWRTREILELHWATRCTQAILETRSLWKICKEIAKRFSPIFSEILTQIHWIYRSKKVEGESPKKNLRRYIKQRDQPKSFQKLMFGKINVLSSSWTQFSEQFRFWGNLMNEIRSRTVHYYVALPCALLSQRRIDTLALDKCFC